MRLNVEIRRANQFDNRPSPFSGAGATLADSQSPAPRPRSCPVLCLHGHPGSGAAMSVFTDALTAAGFDTYSPDLRGYGKSQTKYPFEMTSHLDDIEALLTEHNIKQCLVLGWSLGGILTLELALRRPEMVRGMILVATAARPRGSHPPISLWDNVITGVTGVLNVALHFIASNPVAPGSMTSGSIASSSTTSNVEPMGGWVRSLGKKSLFRYLIQQHTPVAYQYLAKQGAPALIRMSRQADAALSRAIRAGYSRVPDIKALEMPALMLCGECDRHITAKSSLETARALPNCETRCYPNTAHLFPWEIPDMVNADIQHWLMTHPTLWT
ncbi:MAG: alpha/beta hydrolase [Cyanobacteria bacterium P01_D01_bin.105]